METLVLALPHVVRAGACTYRNGASEQAFAMAVVIVYNAPSIQELLLTRSLVDSILVGDVFSW